MRYAAHVDALKTVFDGSAHPTAMNYIGAGWASVTHTLINDYIGQLGHMPAFQTWLQYFQAHSRFHICANTESPSSIIGLPAGFIDYATSAYRSGGKLFIEPSAASAAGLASLLSLGVMTIDVNQAPPEEHQGNDPIYTLLLDNNGSTHPSVLDHYFLAEDHIVVYDKFINSTSIIFLERVASLLRPNSVMRVRTTSLGQFCLSPNQISARLTAKNPAISVDCKLVPAAFYKSHHDRYIFLGDRLQMDFSAGLDSFGTPNNSGTFSNRKSNISIFSLYKSRSLIIPDVNGGQTTVREIDR